MSKLVRSKKTLVLLATCGMLFQFGGCVNTIGKWAIQGFGWGIGSLPADFINAQFIDPILNPDPAE